MREEPIKLLLVENIDGSAGLVRSALSDVAPKNLAFSLVHATGLAEATRYLQELIFHVVILNLSLADSRGLDSVARIKEAAPTIPIVIVTGLSDERIAIEAMRSGAQDYLVESELDGGMLLRAIRYAIERKKIETQIQQLRNREALLREINLALTSTLDLESVLNILLERIAKLRPEFSVTIRLKSNKTGAFAPVACHNLDADDWKNSRPILGGAGLTQVVVSARKPVVVPDVQNDPRGENREFIGRHRLVAFLGIPLIVKGDVLGVLGFWTKTRHEFSPEEIQFFSTLGSQAVVAISNSLLYKDVRSANERQAALRDFNLAINASLDLRTVLEMLLEKVTTFGCGYACTIRLVNQESGSLEAVASRDVDEKDWKNNTFPLREGLTQAVAAARAPLTIPDLARDHRVRRHDYIRHNGLVSYLGLPLLVQEEFVGVLSIYTKEAHEFSAEETEFLSTLAEQAATAIHNSRLYEKLKAAHAALEKAVEVKSVLMGVMAHELKSPIQVIVGAASLLSRGVFGEITEDQRVRIQSIETGANELVELIDSALEMTRLEQGKLALVATEVSVGALLAEIKAEFSEAFKKKRVELDITMPPPEFLMITDRLRFKEILRNLLDNARKFTARGRVTVAFTSEDDQRVEFIVSDTGVGIPQEYLPKIFDLFYQVDPSQKEHASAGMGLNIVKRLVEAMQGQISVTSKVHQGTTFRVNLPKAFAPVRAE